MSGDGATQPLTPDLFSRFWWYDRTESRDNPSDAPVRIGEPAQVIKKRRADVRSRVVPNDTSKV